MKRLLQFLTKHEASDLHLKVGYSPHVRIGGHLRKLDLPAIPDTACVHGMIRPLVPEKRWNEFEAHGSLDFSAADPSGDRFRINIYRSKSEIHVAVRRVQSKIADFTALKPARHLSQIDQRNDGGIDLGVRRDRLRQELHARRDD